jgi:PAS domain S-box-containing protein
VQSSAQTEGRLKVKVIVRSSVSAYALTFAALMAAVSIRWLLDPWLGDYLPLETLYGAVAVAVWVGGYRSAALAVILGYLVCDWLFMAPRGQLGLDSTRSLIRFYVYLTSCLIIIGFGEAMRRARLRAEASREQLKQEMLQRQKAEESLRLRNEELERLLQALPAAVWVAHDPECRNITSNPYAERLHGVEQGANVSVILSDEERHWGRQIHEGRALAVEELPLQRTIAAGKGVENFEFDLELPDGHTVHLLCNTVPLHDAEGQVRGAVAACLDISPLKAVERQVRESEERFRLAADAVNGNIYDYDLASGKVERSRGLYEVLGYRPDEVPPTVEWWQEQIHPDDLPGMWRQFEQPAGESVLAEYRVRHRDGRWLRVEDRAVIQRDAAGKAVRLVGCTVDVTERWLAQQRLAAVLSSIDDHLVCYDEQWRYTYVNDAAARALGKSKEELLGNSIWDLFPDAVGNQYYRELHEAARERRVIRSEHYYAPFDRWFENHIYPAADGVTVFSSDITERKRAEAARAQLAAIVESSEDAIYTYDFAGTILSWNGGAERLYGWRAEEIIGQSVATLVPPERAAEPRARIIPAVQRGETLTNLETIRRRRDGSVFDALLTASPVRDAAGRASALSNIVRDITERKRLEERYHGLFTSMQEGLLVAELIEGKPDGKVDFRYLDMNPAAERILGLNREQIVGQRARAIIPAVRGDWLQMHAKVARTGDLVRHEVFEPLLKQYHENFAFRPAPGQVAVLFWDITERKQAEEALRDREHQLRVVTDTTPALISYIGADGRYRFVNRQYELWFGHAREEIVGRTMDEVLGPAAVEVLRPHLDAVLRGETVHFEAQTPYRDGGTRWIDAQYIPDPGPAGEILGFFVLVLDITERKQTDEALAATARSLARERERLAVALRTGQMGVYEWRLADPAVWWSPELYPLYGVEPASFTPTLENFSALIHPDDRAELWRKTADCIERRAVFTHEYRIILPAGEVRWLASRSHVGLDAAGQVERFIGVAMDITERKQAEQALREADRRKDEFLATLAHELRNPLAPIRNAVQILQAKCPPLPDLQWAGDIISRQTDQMTRLVDDLLDVSRITRGKIELRKQRVELRSVINDAVEASRPLIEQCGHTLAVELPTEPLTLEADPTRLAQVLLNLLNNAAKYTERGGHIRLKARREDGHIVLRVKDNGVGIPPDMLPRIFEMFAQVDHSLERSQGGLGIGLTLVQRLAALHGGAVEAHSQGPGQGSEFIVRLPAAMEKIEEEEHAAPPASAARAPLPAAAPLRILVVDDNEDSANSLALFLQIMGHEVRTAHDGLAAVAEAEAFQPGVILLDIGLPKLNGYEAAQRIRAQRGCDALLIALTGWGQLEDRRRSKAAGFDHHLTKPVDFDDLNKLLANPVRG